MRVADKPALTVTRTAEPVARTPAAQVPAVSGGLRYDGGPANPVPMPKPDAGPKPQGAAAAPGLPVSLKPKASPYTYKAYGEK
jgi:hypothetical protein